MGSTVVRVVAEADDLELVAAVDPRSAGAALDDLAGTTGSGIVVGGDLSGLARAGAEVAVDFTNAASARVNLDQCAREGIHVVVGTTGLDEADLAHFGEIFSLPNGPNCIFAANFSITALLLMRLSEIAAPFFDSVEIIELHHDHKRDAPSGTSVETARRIAEARARAGAPPLRRDPTETVVLDGARGATGPGGVHIHAVRLRGLVAHEEVHFGSGGETLTLRQDSLDRESFMSGVVLAIRRVKDTPGLTVGLDSLMFSS
jgi:4-hydroxy-tetrahydrodipicolinate reductase